MIEKTLSQHCSLLVELCHVSLVSADWQKPGPSSHTERAAATFPKSREAAPGVQWNAHQNNPGYLYGSRFTFETRKGPQTLLIVRCGFLSPASKRVTGLVVQLHSKFLSRVRPRSFDSESRKFVLSSGAVVSICALKLHLTSNDLIHFCSLSFCGCT